MAGGLTWVCGTGYTAGVFMVTAMAVMAVPAQEMTIQRES